MKSLLQKLVRGLSVVCLKLSDLLSHLSVKLLQLGQL